MRKIDKHCYERIEKNLISLLTLCFAPNGTTSRRECSKVYIHGCRRPGFFSLKVGDTFVEKWCMTYGDFPAPREVELLRENNLHVEFEHPEFLASVRAKVCGGTNLGNWIAGKWEDHDPRAVPTYFEIEYCEFVGDIDALESEALLANLSHDFG